MLSTGFLMRPRMLSLHRDDIEPLELRARQEGATKCLCFTMPSRRRKCRHHEGAGAACFRWVRVADASKK